MSIGLTVAAASEFATTRLRQQNVAEKSRSGKFQSRGCHKIATKKPARTVSARQQRSIQKFGEGCLHHETRTPSRLAAIAAVWPGMVLPKRWRSSAVVRLASRRDAKNRAKSFITHLHCLLRRVAFA